MMNMLGLETLREIPGYSAIIKAVLKSLIQGLLEQLSEQTGEESVILTASVSDGTLCHLGSLAGKDFLEGREEIKSQFLRHCLKKHHSIPVNTAETQKRHRETYDGAQGYSFSPENSSKRSTPTESSSTDWTGHTTIPQKRRRGMEFNSLDGATMEHSWSQNSFEKYQSQNKSENDDSTFSIHTTSRKSSEFNVRTGEQTSQSLSRSHSLVMENQTDSSDQVESEETLLPETETGSEAIVKLEPEDNDVTITGMEPGQNHSEYEESWTPGIGDLQGYNAAMQGASNFTGDHSQVLITTARQKVMGDHSDGTMTLATPNNNSQSYMEGTSKSNIIQNWQMLARKRFPCDLCGKSFMQKCDLKRHQTVHTGERFYCSYCPKSFSQKHQRNLHEMGQHKIQQQS